MPDDELVWVDLQGREEPIPQTIPGSYYAARISPDGSKAVMMSMEERFNIHLLDLERGQSRVLAGGDADDAWPLWTLDGNRVVFNSNRR